MHHSSRQLSHIEDTSGDFHVRSPWRRSATPPRTACPDRNGTGRRPGLSLQLSYLAPSRRPFGVSSVGQLPSLGWFPGVDDSNGGYGGPSHGHRQRTQGGLLRHPGPPARDRPGLRGGQDASYWKNLVPALSKSTGSEIITYDRAGMGASDEVPGPWKVQDAVSDLAAGLTALDATHDVVLVSHSEAGEIATDFVDDHPGWVSGAVLVDASLPEFYTDAEIDKIVAVNQGQIAAPANQPSTPQTRQLIAVAQNYGPAHQAYHKLAWPQNIPATVIVSAKTPFDTSPPDAQLWRDAQAAFAAKAPNRQLITAAGSSHDVPIDRPDVILQAVDAMVAKVG